MVDTDVVSPIYPNFYLQSHAGMLGSESLPSVDIKRVIPTLLSARKSSHYTILHNEDKSLNADL